MQYGEIIYGCTTCVKGGISKIQYFTLKNLLIFRKGKNNAGQVKYKSGATATDNVPMPQEKL